MRKHLASLMPNDPVGMGVDPYASYLIYDTVTDDDGDIANHTPEKDSVGGGYITDAGSPWIYGNHVQAASGTSGNSCAVLETNESDIIITCTIVPQNATAVNEQEGICFRYKDSDDYWMYRLYRTSTLYLSKKVNGGETHYAASVSLTKGQEYTLKVVLSADSIICYLDDVEKLNKTDSTHQTETKHGFFIYDDNEGYADNLTIVDNS